MSMKVLVVDDDPAVLRVTKRRLEDLGVEVETRDQALGTSQFISQYRPDVVLLDVNMPALSGEKLASLITENRNLRDTAIIFHSSVELSELQALAERMNVAGAIPKSGESALFAAHFKRLARHAGLAFPEPGA